MPLTYRENLELLAGNPWDSDLWIRFLRYYVEGMFIIDLDRTAILRHCYNQDLEAINEKIAKYVSRRLNSHMKTYLGGGESRRFSLASFLQDVGCYIDRVRPRPPRIRVGRLVSR